jgi:Ca2+-binding RTX toxin-like protein
MLGIGALVTASVGTVLTTGTAHAASTVTFADGVLSIKGDAGSNSLTVSRNDAGAITLNGLAVLDGQATVDNVQIIGMDGGEGNDTLRIDETNGAMPPGKFAGGPGNDHLVGGSRDDILDGAEGGDRIEGGAGADRIDGSAGNDKVIGGPGIDTVDLGADADEFTWKTGEGDDVMVDGGGQKDTLRVTGSDGSDSLSTDTNFNDPSQAFAHLIVVGQGSEFMNFAGFEEMKIDLGAGADVASVGDLSTAGMQVTRVGLDPATGSDGSRDGASVNGQLFGPNKIRVLGTPSIGVTVSDLGDTSVLIAGAETLTVTGGVGPDIVDASRLAAGTTELTENLDGGIAGDVLVGSPGNDTLRGGPGDDRIECRGGVDKVDLGAGGHDTVIC